VVLLIVLAACTNDVSPREANGHTIAYLLDGSSADAELVTSPALAGLELAARGPGNVQIEPLDVGVGRDDAMASLRELGEDRGVVAAVIAPWTAPPAGAIELLAGEGVPVVTFSWAWGPPDEGARLWHSFVPERAREAVNLLTEAAGLASGDALCLAGDDHVTSRALLATAEELGEAVGEPELVMAGIAATERAETAGVVAARIRGARCPALAWVGSATDAASVLSSIPDPPSVVATSRMKTDEGLEVASSGIGLRSICACVDVSLSTEPTSQRFVHDLQAESAAPPGPFSVEAYDAGRLLIGLLEGGEGTRGALAEALGDLGRFRGLAGTYAFGPDGSRVIAPSAVGVWRASGSRWLPETAPDGPQD
jgi:Periplasmic binding protein